MSTLQALLQYKENQEAQQRATVESISKSVDTFNALRQQGIQNKLGMLTTKISAAQSGIAVGPNGELSYNPSLLNPLSQIMAATKLQADAKTAGNATIYGMAGNAINGLTGNSSSPQQPNVGIPPSVAQFMQGAPSSPQAPGNVPVIPSAAPVQPAVIPQNNAPAAPSNPTSSADSIINTAAPNSYTANNEMAQQPDFTTQKDPFTGESTLQARLQQNALDVQKNASGKTKEYGDQQATGFANASAKLQLTLENWHKMVQATQDATGVGPGRINGVLSKVGGLTGANPYYEPFKTSLLETEVQLAKLSAPSARIGPDLIKTFGVVAPTEFSNSKEAKNNFVTSLTNAYSTYATSNPEKFPQGADIDKFQGMASQMYDNIVGQGALSSKFKEGQQYQAGNQVVTFKNGKFIDPKGQIVNVNMGKSNG